MTIYLVITTGGKKQSRVGGMVKSVSTSGLSSLSGGGGSGGMSGVAGAGVSSGLATEGRRQGMVGAHSSSRFGMADKTRDAVRDKLRPLFNNVRVSFGAFASAVAFCVWCPFLRKGVKNTKGMFLTDVSRDVSGSLR